MPLTLPQHALFTAARLERRLPSRRILIFARIFGMGSLLLFIAYALTGSRTLAGFGFIGLGVWLVGIVWIRFISFHRGRGLMSLPEDVSSLARLDLAAQWPFYIDFSSALIFAGIRNPEDPNEIMNGLLETESGRFFLERIAVSKGDFLAAWDETRRNAAQSVLDFTELVKTAAEHAVRNHRPFITPADVFAGLAVLEKPLVQTLSARGLTADDFGLITHWLAIRAEHRPLRFLDRLLTSPGIGKTWAFAFTPFLDRISRRIDTGGDEDLHIMAHEKEIHELEASLSQGEAANAMVVGDPGVGKMTVVQGLADRIQHGRSVALLNYRRVRVIAMEEILSEKTFGGVESSLARLFREAEGAGNIILVIEDIDHYFVPGLATHLAEALLPFLRSPRIKVIGLATPEGYAKNIAEYPVLKNLFHEVRIEEPGEEAVLAILEDVSLALERRFRKKILYYTLKKIYELSRTYLSQTPFPEKAITLLEESFRSAVEKNVHHIMPEIVEGVLERKFGAAVGGVRKKEKSTLLNLEDILHERIVNQESAIAALADALRRKRAGVAAGAKPAGSFLFLGPTGVGKTETAKALAEAYFGSEERMIRLDMSEFQTIGDLQRLLGSPARHETAYLASKIREQPFSLVLLDEIEKAHPNVLNLFLQVLDEGRMTDAYGKKVDFTNAFIIATSNAGAEFIRESLNAGMSHDDLGKRLVDEILRRGVFSPEFLNRFDGVVVYTPLSAEHVKRVAALLLGRLAKRLEAQGYTLVWSEGILDWLSHHGYSETFGGRELRRLIQETIESQIAKDILAEKYSKGATISLAPPPGA